MASRIADVIGADDVYTFAADDEVARRVFPGRAVHGSRIGRSRFATRHWQWMLPLSARWWRKLDLDAYDLIVTSSHATVNSVRKAPGALHVSVCYTPMRYAWMWRDELGRVPPAVRPVWPLVARLLRRSDRRRSRNVDAFIAISAAVAQRIERWYGQPALVVHPLVDTAFFTPDADVVREPFFLFAGRLVAYKRAEVAVRAADIAGVDLVVAGGGPDAKHLERIAGPRVRFVSDPSDAELRDLYRRTRAFVLPGEEDFGITPVEAQACGAPVIAYRRGGACETVLDGVTGVLYADPSPSHLAAVFRSFDAGRFDPGAARENALRFSPERFDAEVREAIGLAWDRHVAVRNAPLPHPGDAR